MLEPHILIADIGGTNARFAVAAEQGAGFELSQVFKCADFESVEHAIDTYLSNQQLPRLGGICFAAAGPIVNQKISFTNNHWVIDCQRLKARYRTDNVQLLNDFEAIAYGVSRLDSQKVLPISNNKNLPNGQNYTAAVLGPGTGLGVAGLRCHNGDLAPLVGEGGHCGFAPESAEQAELLMVMQSSFPRVSNERLLSGPGLQNIYHALCLIEDVEASQLSSAEIFALSHRGENALCQRAELLFFEILGQVAGDVVLALGAYDGVFIAGGICQRYPKSLLNSAFIRGFTNKGRHAHLLEQTPSWLITEENPGLLGASAYGSATFGLS